MADTSFGSAVSGAFASKLYTYTTCRRAYIPPSCLYTYIHIRVYVCMYVYIYIYIHIYIYTYIYIYVEVGVSTPQTLCIPILVYILCVYISRSRYIAREREREGERERERERPWLLGWRAAAIETRGFVVRLLRYISGDEPKAAWRYLSSRYSCNSGLCS